MFANVNGVLSPLVPSGRASHDIVQVSRGGAEPYSTGPGTFATG
jgi:hypothetical protein